FFSRIVENSLRTVAPSLVTVAQASGASPLQIITSVQLSEAAPSIIGGLTINTIAMIEYSAIAGTIGAGGIGYVAVTYGYQRFDHAVMIATIVVLVALVAAVQLVGDAFARAADPRSSSAARRRARTHPVDTQQFLTQQSPTHQSPTHQSPENTLLENDRVH
ncbi:MAG: ABC transporter permease subunit, partial [Janthinobacterium lividum]